MPFFAVFASFMPSSYVAHVTKIMKQGGIEDITPKSFIGASVLLSFILGLVTIFAVRALLPSLEFAWLLTAGLVAALLVIAITEGYLLTRAEQRARKIEDYLADALQLIASNIRAGMTLENAIWTSARPEFGPLSDEIKKVSADTLGGKPVREALLAMVDRVRSPVVGRAVKLVVEGIRLGGQMAPLLDATARDVQVERMLKKEIVASTTTYAIFIVFSAVIIAPILFGISVFYAEVNEAISKRTQGGPDLSSSGVGGAGVGVPVSGFKRSSGGNQVSASLLQNFALASVALTAAVSALIISAIRNGKALLGVTTAPLFAGIAVAIFFVTLGLVRGAFAGLTGGAGI
ncbi:MAG TPA: type II secretion system F family protein [Candidatus Norongarragalinales archaeon]|jgi:flagellar protein FlaJ|nr:type II secretion system F family protein [Candidatus Norongarragalinales archaeon]